MIRRVPSGRLAPYVEMLWWSRRAGRASVDGAQGWARVDRRDVDATCDEHVLPSGRAQLVVALHDRAFSWTAPTGASGTWLGAIVHGPQSTYYRNARKPAGIVLGASFAAGAAAAVLGAGARELAERHVTLDDLWSPRETLVLRERLASSESPEAALAEFDAALCAHIRRPLMMHPAVARALFEARDASQPFRVGAFARDVGLAERHVIGHFRESTGLTPGRYFRVQRFSAALRALAHPDRVSLGALAAELGYADQAHLARDFRELAGVSATRYAPLDANSAHHHVVESGISKTPARGSRILTREHVRDMRT